jgi:hypothetical protein
MNFDTNTRGHQQWFFFRVRNMKKDTKYKINIWNFTKPKSLFKEGMKLSWRSKKRQKMFGIKDEHSAWDFIPDSNIVGGIRYFRSKLTPSKEKKG